MLTRCHQDGDVPRSPLAKWYPPPSVGDQAHQQFRSTGCRGTLDDPVVPDHGASLYWRDRVTLRPLSFLVVLLAGGFLSTGVLAEADDWPSAGADLGNSRYQSKGNKIKAHTVGSLVKKWEFSTSGDVTAHPAADGKNLTSRTRRAFSTSSTRKPERWSGNGRFPTTPDSLAIPPAVRPQLTTRL
jgi:hypothetical protein